MKKQKTETTVILEIPEYIKKDIVELEVSFYNFNGNLSFGFIEVHKEIKNDIRDLFKIILKEKFPLSSVDKISKFGRDDDLSMEANNSSAFNYRTVTNKPDVLSIHAYGLALDINPLQNPYIDGEKVYPKGAVYDELTPGTLRSDSFIVKFLKERGFIWGGDWEKPYLDYMHFHKEPSLGLKEKYENQRKK